MCDFVSERIKNGKSDKDIIEDLLDSNLAPDTSSKIFLLLILPI